MSEDNIYAVAILVGLYVLVTYIIYAVVLVHKYPGSQPPPATEWLSLALAPLWLPIWVVRNGIPLLIRVAVTGKVGA
jgi:hypothetical protein